MTSCFILTVSAVLQFMLRLLKIDLQLRLLQRHGLRSRDHSIADQRPSIFSYFNY